MEKEPKRPRFMLALWSQPFSESQAHKTLIEGGWAWHQGWYSRGDRHMESTQLVTESERPEGGYEFWRRAGDTSDVAVLRWLQAHRSAPALDTLMDEARSDATSVRPNVARRVDGELLSRFRRAIAHADASNAQPSILARAEARSNDLGAVGDSLAEARKALRGAKEEESIWTQTVEAHSKPQGSALVRSMALQQLEAIGDKVKNAERRVQTLVGALHVETEAAVADLRWCAKLADSFHAWKRLARSYTARAAMASIEDARAAVAAFLAASAAERERLRRIEQQQQDALAAKLAACRSANAASRAYDRKDAAHARAYRRKLQAAIATIRHQAQHEVSRSSGA